MLLKTIFSSSLLISDVLTSQLTALNTLASLIIYGYVVEYGSTLENFKFESD